MKVKVKKKLNTIKNIKHKKVILLVILLALIFILCLITFILRKNLIKEIDEEILKEEVVRDITFEPYSNIDGKLKLLVTIEDKEYNIESVSYTDKNGKDIELSAKKNKIAIDYETRRIWRI